MGSADTDRQARGRSGPVLVVGGINADVLGRSLRPLELHTSNPARAGVTPGGVARNISELLARLLPGKPPVRLLGAVGHDPLGAGVLAATAAAGVDVSGVLHLAGQTGLYLAVLDDRGELHLGLAAMDLTEALTPDLTAPWRDEVAGAALLVLDANLPTATVASLLEAARAAQVRTVLEPVSAPKAARLARDLKGHLNGLYLIKPDRAELEALGGHSDPDRAARTLLDQGAEHVLLTLGAEGSLLYRSHGPPLPTPAPVTQVQDVTGAGDALVAGLSAALVRRLTLPQAVRVGHACAALTVASASTVPDNLNWEEALKSALDGQGTLPVH